METVDGISVVILPGSDRNTGPIIQYCAYILQSGAQHIIQPDIVGDAVAPVGEIYLLLYGVAGSVIDFWGYLD